MWPFRPRSYLPIGPRLTSLFGDPPPVDPLFLSVRAILNDDWDPLPGTPDDEYDEVSRQVVVMIRAGTAVDALVEVMREFELGLGDYLLEDAVRQNAAERLCRLEPLPT